MAHALNRSFLIPITQELPVFFPLALFTLFRILKSFQVLWFNFVFASL